MKTNEFKKLEKKIKLNNFYESYKGLNVIMKILSYLGHLASIFLAFFFVSNVIGGAMTDNPVVVFISSLAILIGIELLKRDIFDKFSIGFLKTKNLKSVFPLFILSLLLIGASFYSSINGSKELAEKGKEMEVEMKQEVTTYKDSIYSVYQEKIDKYDNRNEILFEQNLNYDKQIEELPINYATQRSRFMNEKDKNDDRISRNKEEIEKLKTERDDIINNYEGELTSDLDKNKEENKKNSLLFVILSTIIEFVILLGVYFSQYYTIKSYKEERKKRESDPNYQKWVLYDTILNVIYTKDTKINEKLPSNKLIVDMCEVSGILILPKDLTNFLKLLNRLDIIRSRGPVKYINKPEDISREILRDNFNIN